MRITTEIKVEIDRISNEHSGMITAEMVLEEARNKKSPLHDAGFEWDKNVAHEKLLLAQARSLISIYRMEVTRSERTYSLPKFVRDPLVRSTEQGYVSLEIARNDEDRAKMILRREFSNAQAAMARARNMAEYLSLDQEVDAITQAIDTILGKVSKDPPTSAV